MEKLRNLKIIFTKHAKERLRECNLEFKKVYGMIRNSEPEKPLHDRAYKRDRYGNDQEGVFHRRNGTFVFTCKIVENKFNPGEEVILVITMCDQRATVKDTNFGT
jgi:hypothetical protein